MSTRRAIGPVRVARLVEAMEGAGMARTPLVKAGFKPMGDAASVCADANSALEEARIPRYEARVIDGTPYLIHR